MLNQDYMFNVMYNNGQFEFNLPSNSNVSDVKLKIYEKTRIHPFFQNIKGWTNIPATEQQILSSFLPLTQNILWLSSTSTDNKTFINECSFLLTHREEIQTCVSFIGKYNLKYGNDHVIFHTRPLEEAIKEVCSLSLPSPKIIALYFHIEDDPFAQMICPNFINSEIRRILEKSYFVIGWDVSNEALHGFLKKTLDKNIDFQYAQVMLVEKHCALLIVYPFEDSITIFSVLHGNKVKSKDLLTTLQMIAENFEIDIKNAKELEKLKEKTSKGNDIGSREFQQLMYDCLSDRDYDCFEYDEHRYLKEKIGFAKFGPPQSENGYNEKQTKHIEETYKKIRLHSNKYTKWQDRIFIAFIFNCLEALPEEKIKRAKEYSDYNPNADVYPLPVFVIPKCQESDDPCRLFIDNDNRVYESWKDYIEHNNLHRCSMIVPLNGCYAGNDKGEVLLEKHLSPACKMTRAILTGSDIASIVVGLVSGAIYVSAMIPVLSIAPIALLGAALTDVGVGIYSVIRNGCNIQDRKKHGESLSFINSEARGAYINIIAAAFGFVGVGATTVVSHLSARGVNIGKGARVAVNTIEILNIGAGGINVANSAYEIVNDWLAEQRTPSVLTVVQLSSSILFFGNAVYNFKSADVIIEESQMDVLRRHHESLRNNKHKRIFNKMIKERIAKNNGNISMARAEIISNIRNIGNRNEIFAKLVRNNKLFNEKDLRFSSENGDVKLNGIPVDLSGLKTINDADLSWPLQSTTVNAADIIRTMNAIRTIFDMGTVNIAVKYGQFIYNKCTFVQLVSTLLQDFSSAIQEKIIRICKILCDKLLETIDFPKIFNGYFFHVSKEPLVVIFKLVMDFIKMKVNCNKYEKQKDQKPEDFGNKFKEDMVIVWFENIVNKLIMDASVDERSLGELIQYVMNVITGTLYNYCDSEEKRRKRVRNTASSAHKMACKSCGGFYYSQDNS